MEALQLKVALRILEHAGIAACVVGEIALNYYNVPRVLHDIEICVPEGSQEKAALLLHGTGLFEPENVADFNLYTEYKRGCPRLRSSSWISPSCTFLLVDDSSYGLSPIVHHLVHRSMDSPNLVCSSQILDIIPEAQVHQLPIPRLPSFFGGLCRRFLETRDDIAMIAAEQLVDGMNIDDDWCKRNLRTASAETIRLADKLVSERALRLDDFSGNTVTCFIANPEEAEKLKLIPGYE